jgi:hypothetical protein
MVERPLDVLKWKIRNERVGDAAFHLLIVLCGLRDLRGEKIADRTNSEL